MQVNTEDVHGLSLSAQCAVNTEDVHRVSVQPYPTKAGSVFTSAYIFKWKQRREGWLNRNVGALMNSAPGSRVSFRIACMRHIALLHPLHLVFFEEQKICRNSSQSVSGTTVREGEVDLGTNCIYMKNTLVFQYSNIVFNIDEQDRFFRT